MNDIKNLSNTNKNNINNNTSTSSNIDIEQEKNKSMFQYNILKMYYGEPYWVTDKIEIFQPTIGDIIEFDDSKFYSIISTLCSNTTSFRLQLWDMGIDWTKISDFELFIQFIKNFTPKDTYLVFGDLNLSWFVPYIQEDGEDKIIKLIYIPRDEHGNPPNDFKIDENTIIIDELVYLKIVDYLRTMFDIHPKEERNVKGKVAKQWIIDEERMNFENQKKNNDQQKSFLFPLISAMLNHPGFKYKKNELKEVCIVEFMDSVKRLQTYESVIAFMSGMYSGMVDTSKIKNLNKELNWMRDLY